jgi:hypothetical protein
MRIKQCIKHERTQTSHFTTKQFQHFPTTQFTSYTTRAHTHSISAQDYTQKLVNTILPSIVELAASTLSSAPDDTALRKTAVLLLTSCTLMNKVHREFAFQVLYLSLGFLPFFLSFCLSETKICMLSLVKNVLFVFSTDVCH